MAGHAQLKFVMTECAKTQIRLTGLICLMKTKYIIINSLLYLKSCFLYKSDCAAFGTAVEQIRRVCDYNSRIIFVNVHKTYAVGIH